ncbi:MAG: SDR family oxidoreductase [Clostridia bacterium]
MENLNILITGASGAIGSALAKTFERYNLILQYNNNKPSFLSENAICVQADLREETQVNNLFDKAEEKFGAVDVVINNCGISEFSLLQDLSLEQWKNMFAVNVTSAFLTSKRAIPNMLKNQKGYIINISSIWGEIGASCEVHYSASKGALITFTKALAKELAPSGILVNCVSPGLIESSMNAHLSEDDIKEFESEIPLGRSGKGEEVASLVKYLIESGTYITGQNLSVNGGLS